MRHLLCVAILALVCVGCGLSPKQAASLDRMDKALVQAQKRIAEYDQQIADIKGMVLAKKLDPAKALATIAKITANKATELAVIEEVKGSVKELRAQEVPWYYYVGPVLAAVLGIAGGYIPGAKKAAVVVKQLDQAGRMIGSMVHAVDKVGDKATKKAIAEETLATGVGPELHKVVRELTFNNKTGKHT